jgi:hypothetical protein
MIRINIKEPIWNGGADARCVGIAEYRMTDEQLLINIEYINKYKERIYPNPYFITKTKALTYPVKKVKGVNLRIIPIRDLVRGI